jgi:hypothetical protein
MTDCLQVDYALSPDFDTPESLFVMEGYTVPGDTLPFQPMRVFATYNPGSLFVLGDQSLAYDGFPSVQGILSYATYLQVKWLSDTYCNGGFSGQVTAAITTTTPNTIEYWNAILRLQPPGAARAVIPGYTDYVLTYVLIEQLTFGYLLAEDESNLLFEDGSTLIALE